MNKTVILKAGWIATNIIGFLLIFFGAVYHKGQTATNLVLGGVALMGVSNVIKWRAFRHR